jgi:hypothetical protein
MKAGIAAMVVALIIGCHHDMKAGAEVVNLWANKTVEKCFDLAVGETLAYRFNANDSVLFNIHYHREKDVIHEIAEHLIARSNGTFEPHSNGRYCLTWTNPNLRMAKLEYDYAIR